MSFYILLFLQPYKRDLSLPLIETEDILENLFKDIQITYKTRYTENFSKSDVRRDARLRHMISSRLMFLLDSLDGHYIVYIR